MVVKDISLMKTVIKFSRLAEKFPNHPIIVRMAKEIFYRTTEQGSWESYGAGEIGCQVKYYPITSEDQYDYIVVAELSGDNGCNRLYNPSGIPWTETVGDISDSTIVEAAILISRDIRYNIPYINMVASSLRGAVSLSGYVPGLMEVHTGNRRRRVRK